MNVRTCKCGGKFVMRPHCVSGKLAPINAEPDDYGNIAVTESGCYRLLRKQEVMSFTGKRYLNHFSDCPNAKEFGR